MLQGSLQPWQWQVVRRTGKLAYVWRGLAHLPALIEQLKREEEMGQPVRDRKGAATLSQPAERPTTHSLWVLSRKFIRLLLTKKVPAHLPSQQNGRNRGLWLRLEPCRCTASGCEPVAMLWCRVLSS